MAGHELELHYLDSVDEEAPHRSLKRLPNPVTTPRRGPLALHVHSSHEQAPPPQAKDKTKSHTVFLYQPPVIPKHGGQLTRFPVTNVQRPMDQIEQELGDIMCSEIGENIHLISGWQNSHKNTKPHLPTLHPMLKYTPLGGQLLQDEKKHVGREQHTTYTNHQGPMNISITYSRHATPRTQSTMAGNPNQFWKGPLATYPPAVSSSNRLPVSSRNVKRYHTQKGERYNNCTTQLNTRNTGRSSSVPSNHKLHMTGHQVRPSIAPHSLQAETLHRMRPITSGTTLIGRGLGGFNSRHNRIGHHY